MVRVQADTRGFVTDMIKAQMAAKGFQATMTSMTRHVAIGAASAAAATGAMFTGASIKAAMDFESAFTGVIKTIGGTEAEIELLRDGIRGLAKELPISANELARIGQIAGQLGVRGDKNLTGFIETIARIGVATDLTTEGAAIAFARLGHVTGVNLGAAGATGEIEKMASAVVALGNTAATNEPEIVEFASRIAAMGHQVGLSQAEILALSTTLPELGIRAERGGTAMQRALVLITESVVAGGDELDKFAAISNMTSAEFGAMWRDDAYGALQHFLKGLGGMGEEAVVALDQVGLGGERSLEVFLKLMGATDQLSAHLATAEKEFTNTNALLRESDRVFGTFAASIQTFKNIITDVMISFGDMINVHIKSAMEGILTWFNDNGPRLKKWWNNEVKPILDEWLVGVERILVYTGKLFNFILDHKSVMIAAIMAIAAALNFAFGGLPLIIAGLVALIPILVANWESGANAIIALAEGIGNAFIGMFDWTLSKMSDFINKILEGVNEAIRALNKLPKVNIGEVTGVGDWGVDTRLDLGRVRTRYKKDRWYDSEYENMAAGMVDFTPPGAGPGPGLAETENDFDALGDTAEKAAKKVKTFTEVWEDLQDALQERVDEGISALDELGGYLVQALERQYSERFKVLEDNLEGEIKRWEKHYDTLEKQAKQSTDLAITQIEARRDAQVAAIEAQLSAMDSANVADEFQEIADALALAWDPRERKKLLDDREKLEQQVLRDSLKNQIDGIKDGAATEIENMKLQLEQKLAVYETDREAVAASLEASLQAAKDAYSKATEAYALEVEARKMLEEQSLADIVSLIAKYVPEWETAGRSMGEQIVLGLRTTIEPVITELFGRIGALRAAAGIASGGVPNLNDSQISMLNALGLKNKLAGVPEFVSESMRNKITALGGVPAFKNGGQKQGDGWAYMHDGEVVHNRLQEARHGGEEVINIYIGNELLDSRTVKVVRRTMDTDQGRGARFAGARQY